MASQDIVREWATEISRCGLVFYRAASGNANVLFGGKEPPLDRRDPRLRSIPFPTRRATFSEVKRVHELLATVRCHGDSAEAERQFNGEEAAAGVPDAPVRTSTSKKKKARGGGAQIRRSKSREERQRRLPDFVQELADRSSSSDNEDDSLKFDQMTSSTTVLREFESSPVKNNNRKKNKGKAPAKQVDSAAEKNVDGNVGDRNELRNRLLTACKTGNSSALKECLRDAEDGIGDTTVESLLNQVGL